MANVDKNEKLIDAALEVIKEMNDYDRKKLNEIKSILSLMSDEDEFIKAFIKEIEAYETILDIMSKEY